MSALAMAGTAGPCSAGKNLFPTGGRVAEMAEMVEMLPSSAMSNEIPCWISTTALISAQNTETKAVPTSLRDDEEKAS